MTRLAGGRGGLVAAAVSLLLVMGVAACSDDGDSDAASVGTAVGQAGGAESELCDSLDSLNDAVSGAGDLNADSTIDEAREAKDGVTGALDDVRDAAGAVGSAIVTVLQTAVQALANAIDGLSGDSTIGEAASGLATQVNAISDALEGLKSTARCS